MKKILLFGIAVAFSAGTLFAQAGGTKQESKPQTAPAGKSETKKDEATFAMRDHVCTPSCKDGKHVYVHGEKGHVCGPECKKMMEKKDVKKVPATKGTEMKPAGDKK